MPIADEHITKFFDDLGYNVVRFIGLRCPSPVAIADITHQTLSKALNEIDGRDIEALVQFGTNLHFMKQAAIEEKKRKKPVISINSASYWHALRLSKINDQYEGYGQLLSTF
jgi:maleate isomerase